MPFKKGRSKTGGRAKGIRNLPSKADRISAEKKAAAQAEIEAAQEAFQQALTGAMKFTPLQVMNAVMLLRIGQGDHEGALAAARDAAPYCHPKLQASDVRVRHSISDSSDDEISKAMSVVE